MLPRFSAQTDAAPRGRGHRAARPSVHLPRPPACPSEKDPSSCRAGSRRPSQPPTGRSSHRRKHGAPREACNILEVRLRERAPMVATPTGDWRRGSALPSHGRGHWFDPSIAHGEVHAVPPGKPWTTQCGRGSVGRASPCQGEGRGFESRRPLRERRTRHHCRERLFHKMRKHRGGLAERRGNGLQSRVHGFESRTHLHRRPRARQGRTTGPTPRAIGAAVARFPDTEEVTGSIPVSPTRTFTPVAASMEMIAG